MPTASRPGARLPFWSSASFQFVVTVLACPSTQEVITTANHPSQQTKISVVGHGRCMTLYMQEQWLQTALGRKAEHAHAGALWRLCH